MDDLFLKAAEKAAITAVEKNGKDVLLIDLKTFSTATDYVVIVTSRSSTHARGLSSAIQDAMDEFPIRIRGIESDAKGSWILLDYYGLVVHILDEEERHYYNLERLWKDAKAERFEEGILALKGNGTHF